MRPEHERARLALDQAKKFEFEATKREEEGKGISSCKIELSGIIHSLLRLSRLGIETTLIEHIEGLN